MPKPGLSLSLPPAPELAESLPSGCSLAGWLAANPAGRGNSALQDSGAAPGFLGSNQKFPVPPAQLHEGCATVLVPFVPAQKVGGCLQWCAEEPRCPS